MCGHHPASMYQVLVMGEKFVWDAPESMECKVKSLTSQMQKRDVRTPYLSVGCDNYDTPICGIVIKMPI